MSDVPETNSFLVFKAVYLQNSREINYYYLKMIDKSNIYYDSRLKRRR